jgi:acetyl-CoA carboxylase carboxyltransferase component
MQAATGKVISNSFTLSLRHSVREKERKYIHTYIERQKERKDLERKCTYLHRKTDRKKERKKRFGNKLYICTYIQLHTTYSAGATSE